MYKKAQISGFTLGLFISLIMTTIVMISLVIIVSTNILDSVETVPLTSEIAMQNMLATPGGVFKYDPVINRVDMNIVDRERITTDTEYLNKLTTYDKDLVGAIVKVQVPEGEDKIPITRIYNRDAVQRILAADESPSKAAFPVLLPDGKKAILEFEVYVRDLI